MTPLITVLAMLAAGAASLPDGWVQPADYEDVQLFPSPDSQTSARVRLGVVSVNGGVDVGTVDGGRLIWRPDSAGFAVADSGGSGQTETFGYVDLSVPAPTLSHRLTAAARDRFAEVFSCSGQAWTANTIFRSWTADGRARLVVQEAVHSEGCTERAGMIGVIGDPVSGRVDEVVDAADVRRGWCTAQERTNPGYCYAEP